MKRREFITLLGGRGGVADCGARAAGGKNRTHWISRRRHAIGCREPIGTISSGAT